jgi:group I intron endonuclease
MQETRYIYGLVDPESNQVRYIGKSIKPMQRLQNHMNDKSKCHRANWLQSLKAKGLKPELVIFEMIEGSDDWSWQESEKYWIKRGKSLGWPLTNNTDGGDGVVNLPPETKEKMRKTWLGRKHKPETLIKLSKASKGRVKTKEMRDAMSEKMKGRKITWGDKVSEATRKFSKEQAD